MNCPIIPIYDRVVIIPDEQNKKTETGIILPPDTRKRSNSGTVVAVGGGHDKPIPLQPGDKVIYQRHAGLDMQWNGENYLVVLSHEIVAKIVSDTVPTFIEPGER
jgi:chaperonin GroES